jgi:hypothetical protein
MLVKKIASAEYAFCELKNLWDWNSFTCESFLWVSGYLRRWQLRENRKQDLYRKLTEPIEKEGEVAYT